MKSALVAFVLVFTALLRPGADLAAATAPAAGSPALAGAYTGQWKGADNAGGALELKLVLLNPGEWSAEMTFTFEGSPVRTKFKSARVDGAKVELVFSWEADGATTVCKLTGEFDASKLQGSYKTDSSGEGTWSVQRV